MINLQTIIDSLIKLLINGGVAAATDLIKGVILKGAEQLSEIWQKIFKEKPESKDLVLEVSKEPNNETAKNKLQALLKEVLAQNPELLQQVHHSVKTGDINASEGGVAGAVISGNFKINNK